MTTYGNAPAADCNSCWEPIRFCLTFCCARGDHFHRLRSQINKFSRRTTSLGNLKSDIDKCKLDPCKHLHDRKARWLTDVTLFEETATKKIEEAEREINNIFLRWFCPKNCSFTGLESDVTDLLLEVEELIKEGKHLEGEIEDGKNADGTIVGLVSVTDRILHFVQNPNVRTIGLYDLEGKGNINFLNAISRKLTERRNFDSVIRVGASIGGNKGKLQEAILRKLKISENLWENKSEDDRAVVIERNLRMKKFVLLLDDLTKEWEKSDLSKVGIPLDGKENWSKIIFKSSSEVACVKMRVDVRFEVEFLTAKEAMELPKSVSIPLDVAKIADYVGEWGRGEIIIGRAIVTWIVPHQDYSKHVIVEPGLNGQFIKTKKHFIE